ncbi:MAG: F0F1 ATP synthase subunit B [Candidatus Muproteobacteria bacterium RBG_16_65_34]|uniref:ATP synthase subunit b n=1 Tax=Candidatus Muproteobacteria bacterium RBG_16_65_34 TaxID=1817760 RepID=A0A1F6TU69_9PROT|nr:MAG: F0F1 ATP synthase subunit B [Candidatus Muproteobacteria bacterium RBG_16_65_34]
MNINATLIGQSIAFFLFVWFCMKFIWPPLTRALDERKRTIADGLAAAEKGRREQELGEKKALETIKKAKQDAAEVIALADKRAAEIADEAKANAKAEAERIVTAARADIGQEVNRAREHLRRAVAELATAGAAKILEKEIDAKAHAKLLEAVMKQL